ncbi:hypothetical protein LDENG_00257600 [Lucifuga dentata]|nr:hypothetical protein LDENG_00257600 [Lucifuga dentata]
MKSIVIHFVREDAIAVSLHPNLFLFVTAYFMAKYFCINILQLNLFTVFSSFFFHSGLCFLIRKIMIFWTILLHLCWQTGMLELKLALLYKYPICNAVKDIYF